ncbi:hypothetical protein GCM10027600_01100 [Nocardioides ginsengisegetis]
MCSPATEHDDSSVTGTLQAADADLKTGLYHRLDRHAEGVASPFAMLAQEFISLLGGTTPSDIQQHPSGLTLVHEISRHQLDGDRLTHIYGDTPSVAAPLGELDWIRGNPV